MESKSIKLTPDELYFLGVQLSAKFIDYAYVAAVSDLSENYSTIQKETINGLVAKGYLEEDFSGEVNGTNDLIPFVKPIFFGDKEAELDFLQFDEDGYTNISAYKYHFVDDSIVEVSEGEDNLFILTQVNKLDIIERAKHMVADCLNDFEEETFKPDSEIKTVIAVKCSEAEKYAHIKNFFVNGMRLFVEDDEENIYFITKEDFIMLVKEIMEV